MQTTPQGLTSDNGGNEQHAVVKPERNLLAAMLARAICDSFGATHVERHIVRNAQRWIFAELTPKRPFSFAWTAMQLDLCPVSLQNSLKEKQATGEVHEMVSVLRS